MSTRNLPEDEGQLKHKAGNLTAICEPNVIQNVGASISHNPMGLHSLLQVHKLMFKPSRYVKARIIKHSFWSEIIIK
jgi:hypothetical protein